MFMLEWLVMGIRSSSHFFPVITKLCFVYQTVAQNDSIVTLFKRIVWIQHIEMH